MELPQRRQAAKKICPLQMTGRGANSCELENQQRETTENSEQTKQKKQNRIMQVNAKSPIPGSCSERQSMYSKHKKQYGKS